MLTVKWTPKELVDTPLVRTLNLWKSWHWVYCLLILISYAQFFKKSSVLSSKILFLTGQHFLSGENDCQISWPHPTTGALNAEGSWDQTQHCLVSPHAAAAPGKEWCPRWEGVGPSCAEALCRPTTTLFIACAILQCQDADVCILELI